MLKTIKGKHYDVGIYGLWYGDNYGSQITYYALKNVIQDLGYSVVMISNPLDSKGEKDIDDLISAHPYQFASRQNYEATETFSLDEMAQLNDVCDCFVLGSDQMWNYDLSRAYEYSYFFNFVTDENIKISYATSFGKVKYTAPDSYKEKIGPLLKRFQGLSVRDNFSKDILRQEFGIESIELLDPVFLCKIEYFMELIIKREQLSLKEEYIFAYILDPNEQIGIELSKVAQESGKDVIVIFDLAGNIEEQIQRLGKVDEHVTIWNKPTVEMWLSALYHSEFVITDSFHGMCFSTILKKKYIARPNGRRGSVRFFNLANLLGTRKCLVKEFDKIYDKFCERKDIEINYAVVAKRISPIKEKSITWLKAVLAGRKMGDFGDILDKTDLELCVGCGACVSVCPQNAITLKADKWGYYKPHINHSKCVNCGLCVKKCPNYELPSKTNLVEPDCYEFVAEDKELLNKSSSGGIFSLLAKNMFEKKGKVAGASWRSDFTVEHILIDKEEDLSKLQKSKYLQSYLGSIFRDIKEELEKGGSVLFSGCPCQIAGLKKYLEKEYENLVLVDLLCGSSPSSLFFKKYLEDSFPQDIKKYQFRDKTYHWNCDCIEVTLEDGTILVKKGEKEDYYQSVYHNHTMISKHCEKCKYQNLPRYGDITIGDFWGISKMDSEIESLDGVSVVLCNNSKGKAFFDEVSNYQIKKKVPRKWIGGNGILNKGAQNFVGSRRDRFYQAILTKSFSEAVEYAFLPSTLSSNQDARFMSPLNFESFQKRFTFDSEFWEEHYINEKTVLVTKKENNPFGKYACLKLLNTLKKGKKYKFSIKFRVASAASEIAFHVKESKSKRVQIIFTHHISDVDSKEWVCIDQEFVPNYHDYDEFMVGAAQIIGKGSRYLEIEYIYIVEQ